MFVIKRITDARLARRVMGSFGVEDESAMVFGAFKDDDVLGTAVFVPDGKCLVFHGVDTGRRVDVDLVDGMARAAFSAGMRSGMKEGRLGAEFPREMKISLSKRGYGIDETFLLSKFFARKNCRKK